jgi:hypothetical protein
MQSDQTTPPRLDPNCQCICHRQPGFLHVTACCSAPTATVEETTMTDLPDEIMVWRSMEKLTHIGTWATERYPDEAVAYIPRADAEAAMAAVVERAAKDLDERGQHEQINFGLDRATQNFYRARDIVRAFAPPPGLAMLAELRAERDAADQRAGAMLARIVALEADGEAARSAASTNFARAETAEADRDALALELSHLRPERS